MWVIKLFYWLLHLFTNTEFKEDIDMADDASTWKPKEVLQVNANSQVLTEKFTAIASQTLFKLVSFSYTPLTHSLLVFKNGSLLTPNVDFFEDSATQFHLALASTAGDIIVAIGWIGVTGVASIVGASDFFMSSKAALQAYTGTATYIYLLGVSSAGDGGEGWYRKVTGAAIGTYRDRNDYHILTTVGGDGSAAWVKTNGLEQLYSNGVAGTYISATQFSCVQAELPNFGTFKGARVYIVDDTETEFVATISAVSFSGGVATFTVKDVITSSGAAGTFISVGTVMFSKLSMEPIHPMWPHRGIQYAKAGGTVDAIILDYDILPLENDDTILCVELAGSITVTNPTLKAGTPSTFTVKSIVKGDNQALSLADMAGTNRRCLFSLDTALDKWILLNPVTSVGRGALIYNDTDTAIATDTWNVITTLIQEDNDSDAIHDPITNNTRLTVPVGVTKVQLFGQASFAFNATGYRGVRIYKNGSPSYIGGGINMQSAPVTASLDSALSVHTAEISVVGGDYFQMQCIQGSGGNLNVLGDVNGNESWFAMRIIE